MLPAPWAKRWQRATVQAIRLVNWAACSAGSFPADRPAIARRIGDQHNRIVGSHACETRAHDFGFSDSGGRIPGLVPMAGYRSAPSPLMGLVKNMTSPIFGTFTFRAYRSRRYWSRFSKPAKSFSARWPSRRKPSRSRAGEKADDHFRFDGERSSRRNHRSDSRVGLFRRRNRSQADHRVSDAECGQGPTLADGSRCSIRGRTTTCSCLPRRRRQPRCRVSPCAA